MSILKSGFLQKYSTNIYNNKWKANYLELFNDSTLRWFEKKGDLSSKRSINLKGVSSFLAFGDIIGQLPFKPDLKGEQMNLMIAIPHENSRDTRLSFFLCNNQSEMQEWVNSILQTISGSSNNQSNPNYSSGPPPPSYAPGPSYPPPQNYNAPSTSFQPSGGPPPIGFNIGGGMPSYPPSQPPSMPPQQGSYPPQQQGGYYPTQPPPPTQHGAYPVQQYSGGNYPQQTGYRPGVPPPVGVYGAGASHGGYMAGQVPAQQYIIVDGKKRKKKHKKLKNAAIGLAAGAAGMYATKKMFGGFGHGWGGGWGMHHGFGGSWSSLDSFGSCGSWSFSD